MTTIYLLTADYTTKHSVYLLVEVDSNNMITRFCCPNSLDGLDTTSYRYICYSPFYTEIPKHVKMQVAPELDSVLYVGPIYCLPPKEYYDKFKRTS